MLCGNFMPCSDDAALQQTEGALDCVGVNVSIHVATETVVNLAMLILELTTHRSVVGGEIVGHDEFDIIRDVLVNDFVERAGLDIAYASEAQFSATLPNPNHDFLLAISASGNASVVVMMPTYVGLINFYDAVKRWALHFLHRCADAMTQVPRSLIALLSKHPIDLAGRHAFLGFGQQVGNDEPRNQRQVGVMEHGAHRHRELIMA